MNNSSKRAVKDQMLRELLRNILSVNNISLPCCNTISSLLFTTLSMSSDLGIMSRILFEGLGTKAALLLPEGGDLNPKRLRSADTGPLSSTGVDSRMGLRGTT